MGKHLIAKIGVGGILFLLPFFILPLTGDMQLQFTFPKFAGAFLLGNFCFALMLARDVSPVFALAQFAFAAICLFSGFGTWQIYSYAFAMAGFLTAHWFVRQDDSLQLFLFRLIALSGALVALQAYGQVMGFTWPLTFNPGIDQHHPIGFFGQHTLLGAYLAPITAILLALEWFPVAAFVAFVCILTGSSFTVLALGAGALVVMRHRWGLRPVLGIIGLGVISLGALYLAKPNLDAFAGNGRLAVWKETIACARERPLVGFGPGAFRAVFASHCETRQTGELWGKFEQAHNDFVQVLFDGGRLGLFCLLLVLAGILQAYAHTWWLIGKPHCPIELNRTLICAQGVLASLLANALGNFPWQLSPHYVLGLISSAILLHEAWQLGTINPECFGKIFTRAHLLIERLRPSWLMAQKK